MSTIHPNTKDTILIASTHTAQPSKKRVNMVDLYAKKVNETAASKKVQIHLHAALPIAKM